MRIILLVLILAVYSCAQTMNIKFPVDNPNNIFMIFVEEVEDTNQSVMFPIDSLFQLPDEVWSQFLIDEILGNTLTMINDTVGVVEHIIGFNTAGDSIWLAVAIFVKTDGGVYSDGTGELLTVEKQPSRVGWILVERKKPLWELLMFWE